MPFSNNLPDMRVQAPFRLTRSATIFVREFRGSSRVSWVLRVRANRSNDQAPYVSASIVKFSRVILTSVPRFEGQER